MTADSVAFRSLLSLFCFHFSHINILTTVPNTVRPSSPPRVSSHFRVRAKIPAHTRENTRSTIRTNHCETAIVADPRATFHFEASSRARASKTVFDLLSKQRGKANLQKQKWQQQFSSVERAFIFIFCSFKPNRKWHFPGQFDPFYVRNPSESVDYGQQLICEKNFLICIFFVVFEEENMERGIG